MGITEAIQAAQERAKKGNEVIVVVYHRPLSLDWWDCYMACRYVDMPISSEWKCDAHPNGRIDFQKGKL